MVTYHSGDCPSGGAAPSHQGKWVYFDPIAPEATKVYFTTLDSEVSSALTHVRAQCVEAFEEDPSTKGFVRYLKTNVSKSCPSQIGYLTFKGHVHCMVVSLGYYLDHGE